MALSTELRRAVVMTPAPIHEWFGALPRQSHVRKALDGLHVAWEELRQPNDLRGPTRARTQFGNQSWRWSPIGRWADTETS